MNINGSFANHTYYAGAKRQKIIEDNQTTRQEVLPAKSPKSAATNPAAAESEAFASNFNEAVAKAKIRVVNAQPIRLMSKAEVETRLQNALTGTKVDRVDESKIIAG
ncbi:hypothetical protein [Pseudomonas izuensis]|uniref:hypothetical protein n=1 Tax=Pseudomonas izuensis TaxID=2684212 RepID=UPI0013596CFD|nr:hypothetical protein [Pseudomonas izuensis]